MLVKEKDQRVLPLLNYIDYAKGNIGNKNSKVDSPQKLVKYLNSVEKPVDENSIILFTDTKIQPLLLERVKINKKEDVINAMKKGILAGANALFLSVDEYFVTVEKDVKLFEEISKQIMIRPIDVMYYDKTNNTMYSEKGNHRVDLEESLSLYDELEETEDYSKLKEYTSFGKYYSREKIKELDIVEDIERIKLLLKVGYQHNKQEAFGYVAYGENNKVLEVAEVSLGGVSATIIDPRVILRELILVDELKGVALYHNHPSGVTKPSQEDLDITKRLMNVFEDFNIEYFDHFILGKEDVFSFADNVYGFESKNIDYQELSMEDIEEDWDMEL